MLRFLAGFCGQDDDEPSGPPTPEVPPTVTRDDLEFLYFGSDDAQALETSDHVTMTFAAWGSDPQLALRVLTAQVPAILDVGDCLFMGGTPRVPFVPTQAEQQLRARFNSFRSMGALQFVKYMYVIDEPERESNVSAGQVVDACTLLRAVMDDYTELVGCGLHICYGDGEDYRGIGAVDLVGVDAYGQGADILKGLVPRLKGYLHDHQKIALYPGGAAPWRANPWPFIEYANDNPDVAAVIAFLWVDYTGGKGIRNNDMTTAYRAAGRAVRLARSTA